MYVGPMPRQQQHPIDRSPDTPLGQMLRNVNSSMDTYGMSGLPYDRGSVTNTGRFNLARSEYAFDKSSAENLIDTAFVSSEEQEKRRKALEQREVKLENMNNKDLTKTDKDLMPEDKSRTPVDKDRMPADGKQ